MKFVFPLVLMLVAAAVAEQTYSTENDDLDIEAVVASTDKLKTFYTCFVHDTPCDAVQADFKKDIPESMSQACEKCTAAQKHILRRFLEGLKEKAPQDYEGFLKKFDPEKKYFDKLYKAIADA